MPTPGEAERLRALAIVDDPRKLPDSDKERLARDYLQGVMPSALGKRHGLTSTQVRAFLETPEMEARCKAYKGHMDSVGDQIHFRLCLAAPTIVDRWIQRALDPKDPKHHDCQKLVIEKLLPTRTVHSGDFNVNVGLNSRGNAQFEVAMARIEQVAEDRAINPGATDFQRHLRHGTEGIDTSIEAEATSVTDMVGTPAASPRGGNGSGTSQTPPGVPGGPEPNDDT